MITQHILTDKEYKDIKTALNESLALYDILNRYFADLRNNQEVTINVDEYEFAISHNLVRNQTNIINRNIE